LPLLLAPVLALAGPTWIVGCYGGTTYDDETGIANGSEFIYEVWNTSPSGDANNLVTVTIPAGSGHGVCDTQVPTGWSAEIQPDRTTFCGNGMYISPSGVCLFQIYSTLLGHTNAWAEGESDGHGPFAPFLVSIPAPVPPVVAGVSVDTNGVWLALADVVVPRSSNTVLRADTRTGPWSTTVCFVGTASTTDLWVGGAAPASAFYRVSSRQW
jgi:hypothetical protein